LQDIFSQKEDKMNKFQEMIKIERVKRGLTLMEAAHGMAMSHSTLGRLETDERKPKMDELRLMANFYNISYDDLCFAAERLPEDIYYKAVRSKALQKVIRQFEE